MLYKGIEIDEVNLLVYMKTKATDFSKVQKTVSNWCYKNGIDAGIECPYINDETLEALVYIYLSSNDLFDINQLTNAYEKAEKKFKKTVVALHLHGFTEEGWNEIELTLEEFKNLVENQ
jgi:predicted RNA-binding protein with EMAP domain